ncbi:uncharacterized [Tachysurus ichikawai]
MYKLLPDVDPLMYPDTTVKPNIDRILMILLLGLKQKQHNKDQPKMGYVHSLHASALFGWRTQSMVERLTLVSPSAMSLMTLCRNSRSRPALF